MEKWPESCEDLECSTCHENIVGMSDEWVYVTGEGTMCSLCYDKAAEDDHYIPHGRWVEVPY